MTLVKNACGKYMKSDIIVTMAYEPQDYNHPNSKLMKGGVFVYVNGKLNMKMTKEYYMELEDNIVNYFTEMAKRYGLKGD